MIKVIYGMIGSGKTTYALNNKNKEDVILDYDLLSDALGSNVMIPKIKNILLEFYAKHSINVWYITTKLGSDTLDLLNKFDVEYIWINTLKQQCKINIKNRNRNNENKYIDKLLKVNDEIYNNYFINSNNIDFKVIDVFQNNEKW